MVATHSRQGILYELPTKPAYQYQRAQRIVIWPLAVLPLLLAIAAFYVSSEHFESVQATLRTDRFIRDLDGLLDTIQDAETGQRGYLLTGDTFYLLPFTGAKRRLSYIWPSIEQAAQSAHLSGDIETLRVLIQRKMEELQHTVDLEQSSRHSEALRVVRTGQGLRLMLDIRARVDAIRESQIITFDQRLAHQRNSQRALNAVLALGVLLSFGLVLAKLTINTLYRRERDHIEDEMRRLNETLEARVAERTAELQSRTQDLEVRTRELERSNHDLTQFAYIASHELQEPLRMISNYTGMLLHRYRTKLDAEALEFINYAVEGAQRLRERVDDLLTYSRAGTQRVDRRSVLPIKILNYALANLALAIYENDVTINRELPNEPVLADETKMTQVMENLIDNAIKFRDPVRPLIVDVQAKRSGDNWLFSIADNGIGFEQKYAQRIFQPFQRLHGAGTYPGNGIGLAVCTRIIEHHAGKLWAESTPGQGSTFFFTLPV